MTKQEIQDLQARFGAGEYNNDIKHAVSMALGELQKRLASEETVEEEDVEVEEEVDDDNDPATPPKKVKGKKAKK